jgi:FlaA1/EpsC-like NDP-sugar epimerase
MDRQSLTRSLLGLSRTKKRLLALGIDITFCICTAWLSLVLRLESINFPLKAFLAPSALSLAVAIPFFAYFGLYRAIFRYSGWASLGAIGGASAIYAAIFASVFSIWGVEDVPRSVGILQPLLLFSCVGASRFLARMWLGGFYRGSKLISGAPRILIYGAGSAGRQLAAGLNMSQEMIPIGFLDDDPTLQGNLINGLHVYRPEMLEKTVKRFDVTDVLLAIPSASKARRLEIISSLKNLTVRVRTLPGLMDLAYGRVQVNDLRELDVEDLLGRDPVRPDQTLLDRNIRNQVVLVTGAGGSIGSELCRQILRCHPKLLLLLESSEFALYAINRELTTEAEQSDTPSKTEVIPLIGSVQDARRVNEVVSTWKPHTIYHAAAYKHVPLVEHNPSEGVRNNVYGTLTAATAAMEHGVRNFVLISTDKAVRPTNIMGASKRLAEMVLQALARRQTVEKPESRGTCFSMVRFGNVLGSSGSVVPLFRQQIKEGGPVTLTHRDITRYFMTIPEAAQLVIQAGAMASGGDVFVLDMGEPVRIIDLAKRMIELSGLTPYEANDEQGDIEIRITGLRPGEKLFEELLIGDNPERTEHPRIMRAQEGMEPWATLEPTLQSLSQMLDRNDVGGIRDTLVKLVTGFTPDERIVDWVSLNQGQHGFNRSQGGHSDNSSRSSGPGTVITTNPH